MRKYYTRPCNFYYGNYAKSLVKNKKALNLAGSPNISFDKIEIRFPGRGGASLTPMKVSQLDNIAAARNNKQ